MEEKIKQLIEEELARANEKFPGFASAHEAYAVIKEEVEESQCDMQYIQGAVDDFWMFTKNNMESNQALTAKHIRNRAINLISEVIQVAAMARKFEQFLERQAKEE